MLFIGIKTNLIIYPITPITANPRAQDEAIFKNSIKIIVKIKFNNT
jgi:hypothetical protein